jgi:MFS superfamily sulfate permease-like transporter
MAGNDPQRWAQIAALTALIFTSMSVLAWALMLSSLVNFISETILLGSKMGAAFTIALTRRDSVGNVQEVENSPLSLSRHTRPAACPIVATSRRLT